MATLMDSLSQTVTPDVIGKIGTKLGVDEATAQKATEIGVPLITGGMAKASSTPAGAASIFDMLGKLDPNMAGDLLGGLTGATGAPAAGNDMLSGLFGNALGPITAQIKQATGIDVGPFLPMLVPLVAGAISKFAKSGNLDAAGLANALQTETKAFADSGNPVAGLVSGALNQIGSPISSAGQAVGQTAGAVAGAAGAAAATAGSAARQAGASVSSAANTAVDTAGSMARDVSSTMTGASGGRPTGITILGVLAIIGGVLSLCGGVGLLGIGGLGLSMGAAAGSDAVGLGALSGLLGLGSLASGILTLVGGIGLLGLKNWARLLVLIGAIIGIISALLSLIGALTGGGGSALSSIVGLVINGVIIWYLQRADVKAAFGK
jgi:hypothetical protein